MFFNSFILPHFNYASSLFKNCKKDKIKLLQKLQNRSMRIILNKSFYTHTDFMLKELKWLSITEIYTYNSFCLVYKAINNMLPIYINDLFILNSYIHLYNTRNRNDFHVNIRQSNYLSNCTFSSDLIEFNNLPITLKSCNDFKMFKKLFFNFLFYK